jgi:hypothetical protein
VKAFLEHFAAVVGSVTVVILAMSLCHEYGYFWSIGPQFQTLLTTSDYFANGILWLPFGLVAANSWIDWSQLKEAPTLPTDWKKKSTWIWAAAGVPIFGWSFATFTWPIEFLTAVNIMIIVVFLWSLRWRVYAAKVENLEEPFNVFARQLIRLGPPLLILMFLYGSIDAGIDLKRVDHPYAFYFKDNNVPQLRIFLRNFEKGALVRNAMNDSLEFYKWDSIVSVTRHAPDQPKKLICSLFDLWCPAKPEAP